jgi:hypothetical protein
MDGYLDLPHCIFYPSVAKCQYCKIKSNIAMLEPNSSIIWQHSLVPTHEEWSKDLLRCPFDVLVLDFWIDFLDVLAVAAVAHETKFILPLLVDMLEFVGSL